MTNRQGSMTFDGFSAERHKTSFDVSAAPLRRLAAGVTEHFRRQRDYRRLLEMPDRLLEDVGLTREQIILEMKRGPFRGA